MGSVEGSIELEGSGANLAGKTNLVGMSRDELVRVLIGLDGDARRAKMRATQLWHWIYFRGAKNFDEITNERIFRQDRAGAKTRIWPNRTSWPDLGALQMAECPDGGA